LSRLARSRGDLAGARSMLNGVLKPEPPSRRFDDPWWTYYRRDAENAERELDIWRRTVAARTAS
jgi:hypothetical protein